MMIALVVICCIGLFMIFKNENTFRNRLKIIYAIYIYQLNCLNDGSPITVNYYDMRSYGHVLYRFWDFGYKHILPEEKFKLIEPYIKK